MSEQHKELIRRFYGELENELKLDVADELLHPDFKDVYNTVSPFPVVGIQGIKDLAVWLHDARNSEIVIEDMIAEGDLVMARITSRPRGPEGGAGDESNAVHGVEIFRVEGGKLMERWVFIDLLPVLRSQGALPPQYS